MAYIKSFAQAFTQSTTLFRFYGRLGAGLGGIFSLSKRRVTRCSIRRSRRPGPSTFYISGSVWDW